MPKTLVILNPNAGNGTGKKIWPSIQAALAKGGFEFDLVRTTAPHQGIPLAEQAKRDGYETLVAIGGDGTANEVANGILRQANGESAGTLAIIPVGSGNDFTKALSPQTHWRDAVKRILDGRRRTIDVGRVKAESGQVEDGLDTRYFLNGFDTGFGANVAERAHEFPFLTGTAMYLTAVLRSLIKYSVPHVRLDVDDDPIEQDSTMIAAGNGRCIGGGFWIAPQAAIDDGLLDVIIADGLGRLGILSLLPKVMQGTHIGDPRVKFLRAARVVIDSPDPLTVETDGEIPYKGAHHLEIQVLPRRLRLLG